MPVRKLRSARPSTGSLPQPPSRRTFRPATGDPGSTAAPGSGIDVQRVAPGSIGALRFGGHWSELLCDLGLLGTLRLDLMTAAVRFADRLDLGALRVNGSLGTVAGAAQSLRLLLDRCHSLAVSSGRDVLLIQDDLGRPQGHLRPLATDEAWLWRLVMDGLFGASRCIVLRRDRAPVLSLVDHHPLSALQACCADADEAPGFRDTAELTGQLELQPARMLREAEAGGEIATAVDPALIPCALRSLSEEVLPLAVTVGSDALVLRRDVAFFAYEYARGKARLHSAATQFEIDCAAIDSAWVVGGSRRDGGLRQLRLYDTDGRALAVIGAALGACGGNGFASRGRVEPRFWRSLMNALTS